MIRLKTVHFITKFNSNLPQRFVFNMILWSKGNDLGRIFWLRKNSNLTSVLLSGERTQINIGITIGWRISSFDFGIPKESVTKGDTWTVFNFCSKGSEWDVEEEKFEWSLDEKRERKVSHCWGEELKAEEELDIFAPP